MARRVHAFIEERITLAGQSIPYRIRRSKRAKRMRFIVEVDRGLEVVLPADFDASTLPPLLRKHRLWIIRQLREIEALEQKRQEQRNSHQQSILYQGTSLSIALSTGSTKRRKLTLQEDRLLIQCHEQPTEEQLRVWVERWLRQQARQRLGEQVQVWSRCLGVTPNKLFIKSQKTRWGSCSKAGNLSLNWKLIQVPFEVMDYVVLHEMVHLIESSHNKTFWSVIETYCPNYKAHHNWLDEHGTGLILV